MEKFNHQLITGNRDTGQKAQERYKRDFEKMIGATTKEIVKGFNLFVRKEFWSKKEQKNTLAAIADGPYKDVSTPSTAIVIFVNDRVVRVACDRVVQGSSTKGTIWNEVMERKDRSRKTEKVTSRTLPGIQWIERT